MPTTAYVGLGSNLGDRQGYLDRALQVLQEQPDITVSQVSSYYETEPVGGPPGQNDYLNAVAEIQTDIEPAAVLQRLLDIEQQLGRVRRERSGPRTIDLDLLMYGDVVVKEPGITIPHPEMHLRGFVLEPFAEIASKAVHPVLGATIGELWEKFAPDEKDETEEEELAAGITENRAATVHPAPRSRTPVVSGRDLEGLKAVVTGSTRGIGRAIVLELAAAGAEVIVHGRSTEAAEQVADEIDQLGGKAHILLGDLIQLEECRRLVHNAWEEWGPLDIWINNAGADILTGEAAEWPFAQKLRELLEIDLIATMLMARDVGRRMVERGSGVVVNIGWDKADVGMEGDSGQLFAAVKGGVMAFTKSLALDLAPEVRVNCVAPGWIRTAWGERASMGWQERVVRETPLERWGDPADVAATVHWVVSPAAAFLTGQVVRINGGAVR